MTTTLDALADLGARSAPLTETHRNRLDWDGYVRLPGVLSATEVDQVRSLLAALQAVEGPAAGQEVHQEAGADRLSDLVNKGGLFLGVIAEPLVLAAVAHVLDDDLKLSSLNSRAALPGHGAQRLHADWHEPVAPGDYQVCNSIWLLDDFTPDNGATRVVPGSHRWQRMPPHRETFPDNAGEADDHRADEVLILGNAGDVVVFNSHLWHGGTTNRTDAPRRAMHSYYTRRSHPQQLDQRAHLRPATAAWLTPALAHLLDV